MSGIKSTIVLIVTLCAFFLSAPVLADDRFTDNGDGTVTDHQLGVMWAKTDNQGNINWKQADLWIKYTFPDTLEKLNGTVRMSANSSSGGSGSG